MTDFLRATQKIPTTYSHFNSPFFVFAAEMGEKKKRKSKIEEEKLREKKWKQHRDGRENNENVMIRTTTETETIERKMVANKKEKNKKEI